MNKTTIFYDCVCAKCPFRNFTSTQVKVAPMIFISFSFSHEIHANIIWDSCEPLSPVYTSLSIPSSATSMALTVRRPGRSLRQSTRCWLALGSALPPWRPFYRASCTVTKSQRESVPTVNSASMASSLKVSWSWKR